jgi:glycerol uptake facilitator-like aquaporin
VLRRLAAEGLGTALLLAVVVGSGIMADRLSPDSPAVALLANAVATGAGLYGLITIFGPVSGAHFNPVVSLAAALQGDLAARAAAAYAAIQVIGALFGVWIAHLMFAEPLFQVSETLRGGNAQALSEFVATFGLVLIITGTIAARPQAVAGAVALYVTAAYWFTASTAFANPAVTLARALTDTLSGIAPGSVPGFILAQLAGAVAGVVVGRALFIRRTSP